MPAFTIQCSDFVGLFGIIFSAIKLEGSYMVNRLAFHVISRLAKAYHHRKATDMPIRKRYSLRLRPFSLEKGEPYTLFIGYRWLC